MAPVDLNRNKDSIIKAHKEVSDPASKTNWALFGYEGQTDVLKLVSKGDGGVEEMTEDLSSGKMMYAYLKIIDPNTDLPKFVFINWQGEGVPEVRKGSCASHVRDVQNLLRGAHVSINARTEDDISEDIIKSKVSKASGANYSFHKEERRPMPAIGPVGSVYEKVRPQVEIKPDIREKFWENSEKEEKQRILLEKQRLQQEKNKQEKEAKEREEKEAKAREQRESERLKHICEIREAEKKAGGNDRASDQGHWNEDDAKHDEDERAKRSDQMRKERAAEAKSLAASRTAGARNMFEQKPTSQFDQPNKAPPPARKLKQPAFLENQPDEPAQRKQPIQLPKGSPSPESPKSPPAAAPARAPAAAPPRAPAAIPPSRPAVQPEPEELYEDVAPVSQESESLYEDAESFQKQDLQPQPASEGPHVRNLLAEGVPRRPPSDDEEDDDQNWDEDAPSKVAAAPPAPPARNPEPAPEEELYQDTGNVVSDTGYGDEELYQDTGNVSSSVCARALYDYQAAEDNELTFDPDEIISDIEMVDEGWWIGTRNDGSRGMFPSNYVELI